MAGTATPIFPQTVKNYVAQILPADTTSAKTLMTGAANGSKVEAINVASTDTTARDIVLQVTISAVTYILATIPIPANSGNTNALASVDILRSTLIPGLAYDSNGNKYLYVANGATLSIRSTTTVTAAKEIDAFASGGDF